MTDLVFPHYSRRSLLKGVGAAAVWGATAPVFFGHGVGWSAPEFYDVDPGIDPTGGTNVGAALNQWFVDNVRGPGVVRFPANARYLIDDVTVNVRGAKGVVFEFNNATLFRKKVLPQDLRWPTPKPDPLARTPYFRLAEESEDCAIRGLRVEGMNLQRQLVVSQADARSGGKVYFNSSEGEQKEWQVRDHPGGWGGYTEPFEWEHGILVDNAKRLTIENCNLKGMFGDGICVDGTLTNDVTIQNCTIEGSGRQGIAVIAGHVIRIRNVGILKSSRGGIDLESDQPDELINDVVITGCGIETHLLPIPAEGKGTIHNVSIYNNVLKGMSGWPLFSSVAVPGLPRFGFAFERNLSVFELNKAADPPETRPAGVLLDGVAYAVVRDNSMSFKPSTRMPGVWLDGTSEVTVENNRFIGAVRVARLEGGAKGPTACGNVLVDGAAPVDGRCS